MIRVSRLFENFKFVGKPSNNNKFRDAVMSTSAYLYGDKKRVVAQL